MNRYKIDDIIECTVTGIENYGIFAKIDYEYSGLIHISEISDDFVRNVNDYITIGERIKAKVIEIDEDNLKMKLSIKNIDYKTSKNNKKIVESPRGFEPLANNLDNWVKEQLNKIEEQE